MLLVAIARVYSLIVRGLPTRTFFVYLSVEAVGGVVFLVWPPLASGSSGRGEWATNFRSVA